MIDDDLDFDLDLDTDLPPARDTAPPAEREDTSPAEPEDAGPPGPEEPTEPAAPAPERKGLLARAVAPVSDLRDRLRPPQLTVRNFLVGLLLIVLIILVAENWPPMRLTFIGLWVDIPKAVVLIVDFALGFVVAWVVLRRRESAGAG